MILPRTTAYLLVLAIAGASAVAQEIPTFDKIAADPETFHGQLVRFRFDFTRVLPTVNPLLAFRGITSSNHLQVATPLFGGLTILVNRQREGVVAALKALDTKTEVVITGEIDRLRADNGAVFYYVDVSGVDRVPPPRSTTDPPVVAPPITGTGEKPLAAPLEPGEVLRTLDTLDGKDVAIRVHYFGLTRDLPAWALESAKLAADGHAMLRGTFGLAVVFPTADKPALERLEALKLGTVLVARGTVTRVKRGPFTVGVIVAKSIDVAPAGEGSGSGSGAGSAGKK